jgi:hypothetical protein
LGVIEIANSLPDWSLLTIRHDLIVPFSCPESKNTPSIGIMGRAFEHVWGFLKFLFFDKNSIQSFGGFGRESVRSLAKCKGLL